MSRLFGLLLLLAGLLYPFAVYYGMEHLSPRLFALLLGGLWLARALSQWGKPGNRWMTEPQLPEVAVRYTRTVTQVWAGFFLANGLVVVALNIWAPLSWWTLYTGLIAYGLMGLLFAGEWLVRQRVRRHE